MTPTAELASRNGDGPRIDVVQYRNAVKATMKKREAGPDGVWRRVEPKEEEVDRFLMEAALRGLEPLAGQIYASWEDGVMKAVTNIDGLRLVAERTGQRDGEEDPQWCDKDGNWTDYWPGEENPLSARVRVHKKGTKLPFTGTANWHDFAPTGNAGADSLWQAGEGMPSHMLGIRAEALALRKAFPAELSGLYTIEELGVPSDGPGDTPAAPVDVPAVAPAPVSSPVASPPPPSAPSAGDDGPGPSVIVDAPADQPRGAPALPETKRTLAQVLESGEYDKLRNELTEALFDQPPDRLTDEQTEELAAALREADEAGITAVELERLCKVALKEGKDNVEVRSKAILEWIVERRRKAEDIAAPDHTEPSSQAGDGERQSEAHQQTELDAGVEEASGSGGEDAGNAEQPSGGAVEGDPGPQPPA